MKRPFLHTHTFIKRLADLITFGKIAQVSGKEIQTAEAWGRAVESNENPTGTGKRNPLDLVIQLIGLAHKESPALAREMAEVFPLYVEYLDGISKTSRASGARTVFSTPHFITRR